MRPSFPIVFKVICPLILLSLAPHLSAAKPALPEMGKSLTIALPIDPERTQTMRVERFEVYDPEAKVWVFDESGEKRAHNPSTLQFYLGIPAQSTSERLLLIVDPDKPKEITGFSFTRSGTYSVSGNLGKLTLSELKAPKGIESAASCSTKGGAELMTQEPINFLRTRAASAPLGATRQARLAVETDNEFMSLKFSDNSTAANNWIAQLVATMNAQSFEPDLDLMLTLTTVNLRPSTSPDPYSQNSGGAANQAELEEFGNVWAQNFGAVPRVTAMMLSGKGTNNFGASGIAWLNAYCRLPSFGGSYSFNKIFKFTPALDTVPFDARLVGHEIGHNLGSAHTHCLDTSTAPGLQPVDQCFSGEPGCYSGPTSCPAAGQRTLMSYCNIGACSPAQNDFTFGPFVQNLLQTRIAANFPNCITPAGSVPEQILRNGFEN
jgi:hypothetical protein